MKNYLTGLQLYSVRSDLARDFEGTLKEVSEMGYEGVEFAGLYGHSAKEVKELTRRYAVTPVSAHVPLAEMAAAPDKVFETYAEIGCPYIAVPYLPVEDRPLQPNYSRVLETIAFLTERSNVYGIQMMYHNHDFEFVRLENGVYGYDDLFERIPGLCAEIDTCWVNVAGEDPAEYLRKYSSKIPVVHFKDFVMPGKKGGTLYKLIGDTARTEDDDAGSFSFMPVGYGAQDVPGMIAALKNTACRWIVVEQDEPSMGKSRMECARLSIDYLKQF